MRAIKKAKAFEDPLFVEPTAWAPLYGAWQEKQKTPASLPIVQRMITPKNCFSWIADGYDRLAK